MAPSPAYQQRFFDLILQWLQESQGHAVDEVLSAETYGSDWAGDTEGGFYPEFEVHIQYRDPSGSHWYYVEGEDLKSLWDFVIARAVG